MKSVFAVAVLALGRGQDPSSVDDDGFVRTWLVLAPVGLDAEDAGATEIDKEQVKGEAKLQPKEGDKVTAGGKELAWKAHKTADYFIDFRESFGKDRPEDVVGYAVAYVVAAEEMKDVTVRVGSNDQAKVYLNGHEVLKFSETRTLEMDQDKTEGLTLNKGRNVVVFKVLNEKNNWQGCLRFTTRQGAPVKTLKVSLKPE